MPDVVHHVETRGRRVLWCWTLFECEMQLGALDTLERAMAQNWCSQSDPARDAVFRNFLDFKPDHQPGSVALSHILAFKTNNRLPFPTSSDLFVRASGIKMLLVVLFSQLVLNRNGESGKVAANTDAFVKKHFWHLVEESMGKKMRCPAFSSFATATVSQETR